MKKLIENNRLAQKFYDPETKRVSFHGKRVPEGFGLSHKVRRAYVEHGIVSAVRALRMENNWLSIREAKDEIESYL